MKERKSAGALAVELLEKEPEKNSIVDQQQAMQEDYIKELIACAQSFSKSNPGIDFFIVVLTKSEKLLPNVFRNAFLARKSCPTPNYDQAVYHYIHSRADIEFKWVIPCRDACFHLRENALMASYEERDLLKYVMMFSDGTLYNLCRYLNKEIPDKPKLID